MENEQHSAVSYSTLIAVWAVLIALTIATVTVSRLHAGQASLLVPLLIATVKSSLVLWFFMHLKYERRFFRYLLLFPVVTLGVIIGLTLTDIWYR